MLLFFFFSLPDEKVTFKTHPRKNKRGGKEIREKQKCETGRRRKFQPDQSDLKKERKKLLGKRERKREKKEEEVT